MQTKNSYWLSVLMTLIAIGSPLIMSAENEWIGKWKSDPIKIDTESMIMYLEFNDSGHMTWGFETDNRVPDIGQCVSYISFSGTYEKYGPMFIIQPDQETIKIEIKKLDINKSLADKLGPSSTEILKKSVEKQVSASAKSVFSIYNVGSLIYVTHDDPDETSFIIGDETNAMEINFTRVKK